MCRVTMDHIKVTIGHLRVTLGHLRVIVGFFFLSIPCVKKTEVKHKYSFLSLSKQKENTTELHPKVRPTCFKILMGKNENMFACLMLIC